MKTLALLSICSCFALLGGAEESKTPDEAWDVEVSLGGGRVEYRESVSLAPVESEWDAVIGSLGIQGTRRAGPVEIYGDWRLTGSETETEEWRESGVLIQQNNLSFMASEVRAGVMFPVRETPAFRFRPRIGVSLAWQGYERDAFVFYSGVRRTLPDDNQINEDVFAVGPSAGFDVWTRLSDRFSLDVDTEVIWLPRARAENDGFDVQIDGEGWRWFGRLALWADIRGDRQRLGLSVGLDVQEMEGGIQSNATSTVEWPDNELERVLVEFLYTARF